MKRFSLKGMSKKKKIIIGVVGFLVVAGIAGTETEQPVAQKPAPIEKEEAPVEKEDKPVEKKEPTPVKEEPSKDQSKINKEQAQSIMDQYVLPFFKDSTHVVKDKLMTISIYLDEATTLSVIQDIKYNGAESWDNITKNMDSTSENATTIAQLGGADFGVSIMVHNGVDRDKVFYSNLNGASFYNVKNDL